MINFHSGILALQMFDSVPKNQHVVFSRIYNTKTIVSIFSAIVGYIFADSSSQHKPPSVPTQSMNHFRDDIRLFVHCHAKLEPTPRFPIGRFFIMKIEQKVFIRMIVVILLARSWMNIWTDCLSGTPASLVTYTTLQRVQSSKCADSNPVIKESKVFAHWYLKLNMSCSQLSVLT